MDNEQMIEEVFPGLDANELLNCGPLLRMMKERLKNIEQQILFMQI